MDTGIHVIDTFFDIGFLDCLVSSSPPDFPVPENNRLKQHGNSGACANNFKLRTMF